MMAKEEQTKIRERDGNILDRIYINYTTYSIQTKLTEGTVLVFSKTNKEEPFSQQIPTEKMTIEEFEKKYKQKIKKEEVETK